MFSRRFPDNLVSVTTATRTSIWRRPYRVDYFVSSADGRVVGAVTLKRDQVHTGVRHTTLDCTAHALRPVLVLGVASFLTTLRPGLTCVTHPV